MSRKSLYKEWRHSGWKFRIDPETFLLRGTTEEFSSCQSMADFLKFRSDRRNMFYRLRRIIIDRIETREFRRETTCETF